MQPAGHCLYTWAALLFIFWLNDRLSLTSCFFFSIVAIKTMISSRAHACGRWLARERILPTASWHPRPGLCSKNTIRHWGRPKVGASGEKKLGTRWFLLRVKLMNVGTTRLQTKRSCLCLYVTFKCTFSSQWWFCCRVVFSLTTLNTVF